MKYLEKYSQQMDTEIKEKRTNSLKFFELIENNPIIYDINHPDYGNESLTHKVYSEIASKLNTTGKFFLILCIF